MKLRDLLKETGYKELSIYGVSRDSSEYGFEKRLKNNMLNVAKMVKDADITIETAGGGHYDAATVKFTYKGKRYKVYLESRHMDKKEIVVWPSEGDSFYETFKSDELNKWIAKFISKYNVSVRDSLKKDGKLVGWISNSSDLNLPGLFLKAIDMINRNKQ